MPPPPSPLQHRELRVLHLEDSELDHELMLAHLRRDGLRIHARRVETEAEFHRALDEPWDVILSDFRLPGYTGLAALEWIRQRGLIVPFILISGLIGEDTAVAAMRNGASDYLLKNNLTRLGPAMLHAIEASEALAAKRRADEDLARSQERLRELAQHLQTSVEAERTAIAREIHDDVGGSLTAVKFDLAWIARRAAMLEPQGGDGTEPGIAERAQQALETVNHAIEASQRIMHNLRPAILEQGLVAALQWMTQRFEKRTGVTASFRTNTAQIDLPPSVALVAYRTAQEALTNVSKHAHARHVQLDLTVAAGILSLEISDDGRGLSSKDLAKDRSFGIRGLHERAGTVGGWIDLSSHAEPGRSGTTLILSVPLQPQADALGGEGLPDEDPNDPTSWGDV
jgi:signal transduction histidine kinase